MRRMSEKRTGKSATGTAWLLVVTVAAVFMGFTLAVPCGADASPAPPTFAPLAKKVGPAVVNIATVRQVKNQTMPFGGRYGKEDQDRFEDFFRKFFGDQIPKEYKQRAMGSGFLIDAEGDIITNNHVVAEADKIEVTLSNGKNYEAEVVGRDPKTDIALIRIKDSNSFPHLSFGDSDKIEVGDWVMAVGNPFGLENTVTAGIISAKQRNIGAGPYDDFLQTDASINPGNSGGPLVNMDGEVVGINTAIVATGQGIGFAIPSNLAKNIIDQLRTKGKVVRGWLGVMIQRITPELMKSFSLKDDKGALVADVPEGSPAAKAGIKRGDVITEFDGKPVTDWSELPPMVAATSVGKTVPVKVIRDGKTKVFEVKIGELQESEAEKKAAKKPEEDRLGMTVQELTPELANQFGVEEDKGVVVTDVNAGGPASEAGLRPGDIIKEIQREPVKDMATYRKLTSHLEPKGNVLVLIKRGGSTFFITIELG